MKVLFIKEYKEKKNIIRKVVVAGNQLIGKIHKEESIWDIPTNRERQFNSKFIGKKLANKLYKNDIQGVVLSKELKECKNIVIQLKDKDINILDGRKLFEYLLFDIVEYIFNKKQKRIEDGEVSILINNVDELAINNIIEIAKKVKKLNVISNHIEKLKAIENYLYNELGIMIMCSNNKKSSLIKSDVIINLDFVEELINKYKVHSKAVIISVLDKVNITTKRFSGINCNYFRIDMPEKYKIELFQDEEIYEALIYNLNLQAVKNRFIQDNIGIKYLIGNNGKIEEKEFK